MSFIFWDVTPCSLPKFTYTSVECSDFVFWNKKPSAVKLYQTSWCHVPEESIVYSQSRISNITRNLCGSLMIRHGVERKIVKKKSFSHLLYTFHMERKAYGTINSALSAVCLLPVEMFEPPDEFSQSFVCSYHQRSLLLHTF
jgi:hypothetical protein